MVGSVARRTAIVSTILAVFLGGVMAWAVSQQFHIPYFVLTFVVSLLVQWGLVRVSGRSVWPFASLWGIVSWIVQAGRFALDPIWGMLPLALLGGTLFARKSAARALMVVVAFLVVVINVLTGAAPIWTLLALSLLPLIYGKMRRKWGGEMDTTFLLELAVLMPLFLSVGFLIQGIVR